jgi:hypothetical protein
MLLVKFLQELACAGLVFQNYHRLGYYRWWGLLNAFWAFFKEKYVLRATVLTVTYNGIPVGTMMCSVDNGELPVDKIFPDQMQTLRSQYEKGRIGYFGKFAVAPTLHGEEIGMRLIGSAVNWWSLMNGVYAVVMIVHPKHARKYARFGAKELGRVGSVEGMEKAPAVLMSLDFEDYIRILQGRHERTARNKNKHVHSIMNFPLVA